MRHLFITILLLTAASTVSSAFGHQSAASATRIVHIVAERFSFTPARITVEQGTTLDLRITSDDTSHGFKLTGPQATNIEIPKRGRGEARVTFEATELGVFTFECSRVCGAGHGFMHGAIEVKSRKSEPGT